MQVRAATKSDIESIALLHANSWRVAYRGIFKDDYLNHHALQDRLAVWRERLNSPKTNQYVLVAEDSFSLVGFVCAYGNEDTRWGTLIDNLHVVIERKRQGIGKMLLAEIARWANEYYPNTGLYLGVLERNIPARQFYEALGAVNVESGIWTPPGGGEVIDLRYCWPNANALLNRIE